MRIRPNWKYRWRQLLRRRRDLKKRVAIFFHYVWGDNYEINRAAHPYLRVFTVVLSLVVVASILITLGFGLTPELKQLNHEIVKWLLIGFVINFILRLMLTTDRNYIRHPSGKTGRRTDEHFTGQKRNVGCF